MRFHVYGLPGRLSSLELNIPLSKPKPIKPIGLIEALSMNPEGRTNPVLCFREQQDAQELFQLLSECIKREANAVDKEHSRDPGLGAISTAGGSSRHPNTGFTVFDGLTANRRSCVVCGYTEAVMHFSFDNWQLAVPRAVSETIFCRSPTLLNLLAILRHLRLSVRLHPAREAHRLHMSKVFHGGHTPEASRGG